MLPEQLQIPSTYGLLQSKLGKELFRRIIFKAKDRRFAFLITARTLGQSESTIIEGLAETLRMPMLPTIPSGWKPEGGFEEKLCDFYEHAFVIMKTPGGLRIVACLDPSWVPSYVWREAPSQICLLPYSAIELLLVSL